jgi:hypothetical protein
MACMRSKFSCKKTRAEPAIAGSALILWSRDAMNRVSTLCPMNEFTGYGLFHNNHLLGSSEIISFQSVIHYT